MEQYNTWGEYLSGCEDIFEVEERVLKLCGHNRHLSDIVFVEDNKVTLRVYAPLDSTAVLNKISFQGLDETLDRVYSEVSNPLVDINITGLGLIRLVNLVSEYCKTCDAIQDADTQHVTHMDNFRKSNKSYIDLEEEHNRVEKELAFEVDLLNQRYEERLNQIKARLTSLEDNHEDTINSLFGYEKLKTKNNNLCEELIEEYGLVQQVNNIFELPKR